MSAITTHILDTSLGRPAQGVKIALEYQDVIGVWKAIGQGETDNDGRLKTLLSDDSKFQTGTYRLNFDVGSYFAMQNKESFYTIISIVFVVCDVTQHYHVPLLLNPFGYSTYRGS
jgi:5-hydroxyisourate hydrolase